MEGERKKSVEGEVVLINTVFMKEFALLIKFLLFIVQYRASLQLYVCAYDNIFDVKLFTP